MLLSYTKHGHKFSIAHTTTDHVITVKIHQTQSQTKYGKNQYQTFLKFIGFCMN